MLALMRGFSSPQKPKRRIEKAPDLQANLFGEF
jgi:hypothetical protein